jgi:hypothetical protein
MAHFLDDDDTELQTLRQQFIGRTGRVRHQPPNEGFAFGGRRFTTIRAYRLVGLLKYDLVSVDGMRITAGCERFEEA